MGSLLLGGGGFKDEGVGQIGDFGDKRQIIAAERGGFLPGIPFLVDLQNLRVVPLANLGLVDPHGGLDFAEADYLGGLLLFSVVRLILGHDWFLL